MAKPKPDRQLESLKRAVETLSIDWDTVAIFTTKYDITHDVTIPGVWSVGNRYAIEGQVKEWVAELEEFGSDACGPDCGCRANDEDDDDEDDEDDGPGGEPVGPDDDDDAFNR